MKENFDLLAEYLLSNLEPSSSSACSRPLLDISLSNGMPLSSIFSSTHPTTTSHLADIVTASSWRTPYTMLA
uniref:SFRICE_036319 n=1 Tax=Spodoptera frugiperda TaxID=7108 RepID=A0A2H1WKX1_SPOFR